MENQGKSFLTRIRKTLPVVERFALVVFTLGLVLTDLIEYSNILVSISLTVLAIVFFLTAYIPIEMPQDEEHKTGFNELFTFTIGPKIIWIACSISTVGLQFYFNGLEGPDIMLIVGSITLVPLNFLLGIQFLRRIKYAENLTPIFFRSIPIMVFDIYVLIQLGKISL
ncbi:MAG: hypothetical protein AAF363_07900 [Bacteroidota bacterium]